MSLNFLQTTKFYLWLRSEPSDAPDVTDTTDIALQLSASPLSSHFTPQRIPPKHGFTNAHPMDVVAHLHVAYKSLVVPRTQICLSPCSVAVLSPWRTARRLPSRTTKPAPTQECPLGLLRSIIMNSITSWTTSSVPSLRICLRPKSGLTFSVNCLAIRPSPMRVCGVTRFCPSCAAMTLPSSKQSTNSSASRSSPTLCNLRRATFLLHHYHYHYHHHRRRRRRRLRSTAGLGSADFFARTTLWFSATKCSKSSTSPAQEPKLPQQPQQQMPPPLKHRIPPRLPMGSGPPQQLPRFRTVSRVSSAWQPGFRKQLACRSPLTRIFPDVATWHWVRTPTRTTSLC